MGGLKDFAASLKRETDEGMSLAEFSADLITQVIASAGTTKISAGVLKGRYTIRMGMVKLTGKDPDEAYQKLFYWMATKPPKMSVSEYLERGLEVEKQMNLDTEGVIEILTEEGMTDFGKQVQEYRAQRENKLRREIALLRAENRSLADMTEAQEILVQRTGFEDLTTQEIIIAMTKGTEPT